jgi:hypothetical protein
MIAKKQFCRWNQMFAQIRSMLLSKTGFCDFGPIRDHQFIGFTAKDEPVNLPQELRKEFM